MKDVIEFIRPLAIAKKPFALATVLKTWGSSPRKVGAHMVISRDGTFAGSVSGGCIEGDVARRAKDVLVSAQSSMVQYGVSDEDAWTVGLSCGGKIDVHIQPFFTGHSNEPDLYFWETIFQSLDQDIPAVVFYHISSDQIDRIVLTEASASDDWRLQPLRKAIAERRHLSIEHNHQTYFLEVLAPQSRLVLFGASHIAADLVHFAAQLNFHTVVVDPRGFFTEGTNFKTAPNQLYREWPADILPELHLDQFTYSVTLTHDPKIDDQALHFLLRSDVAYIGALGSKRTHEKRKLRLLKAGFSDDEIARIHGPVGINIKAQTAQEIALSIISQMIEKKNQFIS
jgi:xanthine dehydrogenase accessory factor